MNPIKKTGGAGSKSEAPAVEDPAKTTVAVEDNTDESTAEALASATAPPGGTTGTGTAVTAANAAPAKVVGAADREAAAAARDNAAAAAAERLKTDQYRFISPFPRLVLYVYLGATELVDGRERPAPSKIVFKNGGYFTSDPAVGEALKNHPKCGSQLFRFVSGADAAARMTVASQEEAKMRAPSFQGPTGSSDGNEQEFLAQQAALQRMKNQAFHG